MSEEAAEAVASMVRRILARCGASSVKQDHMTYQENRLTSELQHALDGIRSRWSRDMPLTDYSFALIPMVVPKNQLPSKEERAARILMGLHPEPAAFACRLGLKFTQINGPGPTAGFGYSLGMDMSTSEYTVVVTAEDDDKAHVAQW